MEENIKILEEMVEKSRDLREEEFYKLIGIKQIQSLANLIKGYRGLEAKIKRYEKYLENKDKKFEEALEYEYQERETEFIPKSKIKEKIEEYQLNMKKYEYADKKIFNENNIRQEVITVLHELMEDK